MSISGRKKVMDMQGNHLFSIIKEHFHIHATYAVESAAGEKIMEVKSSFKRKLKEVSGEFWVIIGHRS